MDWDLFAPECLVRSLHRLKLDHRTILISLSPSLRKGKRPFCCLVNWLTHADFQNLVKGNWCSQLRVGDNLMHMKEVLSV